MTAISLLWTDAGRKQLMRLIPPPCSFSDHYWNGSCHHYIFPVGYLKKSLLAFIYMLSNPSDTWANLTRILTFSRPWATLFTSNRTFSKYLDGTHLLSVAGRRLQPTDVITLQYFPCRFDIRPELLWSCLEKGKEGFRPLGRVSISLFAIINKMQMQTGYAPFSWKSYQLHRLFFFKLCFLFLGGDGGWNYGLKKTLIDCLSVCSRSDCLMWQILLVNAPFSLLLLVFLEEALSPELEDCCWCFTKSQFLILLCSLLLQWPVSVSEVPLWGPQQQQSYLRWSGQPMQDYIARVNEAPYSEL